VRRFAPEVSQDVGNNDASTRRDGSFGKGAAETAGAAGDEDAFAGKD
jgi:hypothetical protein